MSDDLTPASPDALLDEIEKQLETTGLFKSVDQLFGKFRVEDLDRISFKTPAVFVSIASGKPSIQHNGQLMLECQLAIMLVTSTKDRTGSPWDLSLACTKLVHRNAFKLANNRHPQNLNVIPVISSTDRRKNNQLTAITWSQTMRIHEVDRPVEEIPIVETQDGTVLYTPGESTE
ncbi:MAG: hypothetical protein JKY49_07540 [Cohaesibacteraceae bacterium]|nr:hypothetical protein [Cohaesibacteraceae bacterium]MBL4876699.1 hypothetical protein [Cohaesibacteraceae bacterium]